MENTLSLGSYVGLTDKKISSMDELYKSSLPKIKATVKSLDGSTEEHFDILGIKKVKNRLPRKRKKLYKKMFGERSYSNSWGSVIMLIIKT